MKLTESLQLSRNYEKHKLSRKHQKPEINSIEVTKDADRCIKHMHKKFTLSKQFNNIETWRSQNKAHLRLISRFEEISKGKQLAVGRHDLHIRNMSNLSLSNSMDPTKIIRSPSVIRSLNFVKRKNDLRDIDR